MKTQHRFHFPKVTGRNVQELPSDFDFHVSIGDRVVLGHCAGNREIGLLSRTQITLFDVDWLYR